jgi:hypothetical protein
LTNNNLYLNFSTDTITFYVPRMKKENPSNLNSNSNNSATGAASKQETVKSVNNNPISQGLANYVQSTTFSQRMSSNSLGFCPS